MLVFAPIISELKFKMKVSLYANKALFYLKFPNDLKSTLVTTRWDMSRCWLKACLLQECPPGLLSVNWMSMLSPLAAFNVISENLAAHPTGLTPTDPMWPFQTRTVTSAVFTWETVRDQPATQLIKQLVCTDAGFLWKRRVGEARLSARRLYLVLDQTTVSRADGRQRVRVGVMELDVAVFVLGSCRCSQFVEISWCLMHAACSYAISKLFSLCVCLPPFINKWTLSIAWMSDFMTWCQRFGWLSWTRLTSPGSVSLAARELWSLTRKTVMYKLHTVICGGQRGEADLQ